MVCTVLFDTLLSIIFPIRSLALSLSLIGSYLIGLQEGDREDSTQSMLGK